MNLDPYVPKSQFLLKTDTLNPQQGLQNQTSDPSQEQSAQNQAFSFQGEQLDFQASVYADTHGEPNQVQFATPAASQELVMQIQDWDTVETSDSEQIQKILEYIHETENQNIKTLLDGLQKSLDDAYKTQQENMRYYYQKVRPQIDQLRKVLQETIAQEKADQVKGTQKNLSQLESLIQQMRAELPTASLAQQQAVARVLSRLNETELQ